MIRGLLFVCFLSFCHGGFVRLQNKDPKAILGDPSSDEYIDMILENLRKYIMDNNLDPMGLPDLETGFSDTILGITWHGTAWLREGQFWGLTTIDRTGETSFTVDPVAGVVELSATLSLSRPSAHYKAHADFMGIGVTADANIDIHDVQIFLDATATLTSDGLPEGGLQLKEFRISHLGSIDIDISGLGPLDWILELLVDFIDTFFRDWIKDLVEGLLRDIIQDLFNSIHFEIPPPQIPYLIK